jgi:putative ABC transport system substrate-binding protein
MNRDPSKMQRLILLVIVASVALAACGTPAQAVHITSIGIVNYTPVLEPVIAGLKASFADAGYVEGKTITYLYKGPVANDPSSIDAEIQRISNQNPDLYLALGTIPAKRIRAYVQNTSKYAVFAPVTNPLALGVVQDLRKPGGRMTGIDSARPITRGLEWLLTVVPNTKRVHVFYIKGETLITPNIPLLQATADKLNVQLVTHEVATPDDIVPIVATLKSGTDAIFTTVGQLVLLPNGTNFVEAAVKQGIPVGSSIQPAGNGVLTGVNIDYLQVGKQAGQLAQQIFHGADAGTLPVEPAEFTTQIDLVTASALGLTPADSVLKQVDTIIRVAATPAPTDTK